MSHGNDFIPAALALLLRRKFMIGFVFRKIARLVGTIKWRPALRSSGCTRVETNRIGYVSGELNASSGAMHELLCFVVMPGTSCHFCSLSTEQDGALSGAVSLSDMADNMITHLYLSYACGPPNS